MKNNNTKDTNINKMLFIFKFKNKISNLEIFFNDEKVPNHYNLCYVTILYTTSSFGDPVIMLDKTKIIFKFDSCLIKFDNQFSVPDNKNNNFEKKVLFKIKILDQDFENNYYITFDIFDDILFGKDSKLSIGFPSEEEMIMDFELYEENNYVEIKHISNHSIFFWQI